MDIQKIKSNSALFLFLLVNFAFSVKYLQRITPYYILISFLIAGFSYALWKFRMNTQAAFEKVRHLNVGLLFVFIVISAFVFLKVPVTSLNVDRWSVITSFWDNYFHDDYVYFAKSTFGNAPGPMPFYFMLALPFYLAEKLDYFSLLGVIAFHLLLQHKSRNTHFQSTSLLLLLSSTFYLWEVICRSNIFLNGALVLFSIVYFLNSLEHRKRYFVAHNGIMIGLLLSTRNVFIIPYIVLFLFVLKFRLISIKEFLQIGAVALVSFVITFLPFVMNHFDDFMKANPFVIQSSFLMPLSYSMGCIAISFGTFFFVKQKSDVYFYSGLILFFTILLHHLYKIGEYGFRDALMGSRADISYFILCVPFLLYYVVNIEKQTDIPKPIAIEK